MSALDYINTFSLPCKFYLDFANLSTQSTVGNTYTILNLMGIVDYDFLQTNSSLHPTRSLQGVTFSGSAKIVPRNLNLLSTTTSYSFIVISRNTPTIKQNLFEVGKLNPTLPKLIQLYYDDLKTGLQFSRLNVENSKIFPEELETTQITFLSHDIVKGITDISVNKGDFLRKVNLDNGYLLNNFPSSIILGNSSDVLPFTGELLQVLFFSPSISELHLSALGDLLSGYIPSANLTLNEFRLAASEELAPISTFTTQTPGFRNLVILLSAPNLSGNIPIVSNMSVIASFIWENVDEGNWESVSEALWDTMGL